MPWPGRSHAIATLVTATLAHAGCRRDFARVGRARDARSRFLCRQNADHDRWLCARRRRRHHSAGRRPAPGPLHSRCADAPGAEYGRCRGSRGDELSVPTRGCRRADDRYAGTFLVRRRRAQESGRRVRRRQAQLYRQPWRREFRALRANRDRRPRPRFAESGDQAADLRHARRDDADRHGAGAARRERLSGQDHLRLCIDGARTGRARAGRDRRLLDGRGFRSPAATI